jgi:hypothetical protein
MLRAAAIVSLAGLMGAPALAADLGVYGAPDAGAAVAWGGADCLFEDGGPDISFPWPSIWLGHFSGGLTPQTTYGQPLVWKNEHACFPSKVSCDRWIAANRREYHNPEGHWTCLPIR